MATKKTPRPARKKLSKTLPNLYGMKPEEIARVMLNTKPPKRS